MTQITIPPPTDRVRINITEPYHYTNISLHLRAFYILTTQTFQRILLSVSRIKTTVFRHFLGYHFLFGHSRYDELVNKAIKTASMRCVISFSSSLGAGEGMIY